MAKSQAQKDAEAAEAVQAETKELLGENLEQLSNGVVLDKTDPNYEQLKRLENLRIEVATAQAEAVATGQGVQENVRQAQLDAEEARLRSELASAQQAASQQSAEAGVAKVLDQLQARAEAENAAADATDTSGS